MNHIDESLDHDRTTPTTMVVRNRRSAAGRNALRDGGEIPYSRADSGRPRGRSGVGLEKTTIRGTAVLEYEVEVEDVEYLRRDSTPQLARIFRPLGPGPFPAVVELHGGGWVNNTRIDTPEIKEQVARRGVVVIAIDFRVPPENPYPAALEDVNYAIRWTKANADRLGTRPERVGIAGRSSGGHLAVLTALRPFDPRYAATTSPETAGYDATVRCAVAFWPVISPLGRFRLAEQLVDEGAAPGAILRTAHLAFWENEEAMAEGDPTLALERGEETARPPILCLESPTDWAHPIAHLERFAASYRRVGGEIELVLPGEDETPDLRHALDHESASVISQRTFDTVARFIGAATT